MTIKMSSCTRVHEEDGSLCVYHVHTCIKGLEIYMENIHVETEEYIYTYTLIAATYFIFFIQIFPIALH